MDTNNDFLKNWLEGKIPAEELQSRKDRGDAFVQEFDELITRSSRLKVPDTVTKEEAWQKLSVKLTEAPKNARVVKLNRWIPVSIAASLLLTMIAFFMFSKTTVSTQLAETKVYILPDGSEVVLNADSKLSFRRLGWSDERIVSLEGEAFFNVTKGSTFIVNNEKGTITVLGTSFNVNARASSFEVSCFSGKVNVASGAKEVILTKGLLTKLESNGITNAKPFDQQKTTWRNGDFYFEGQPLSTVINELERQFNVEIIFSGDGSRLYTGYFSNKNLDEALELVFKPMSLNFHQENNKITVK